MSAGGARRSIAGALVALSAVVPGHAQPAPASNGGGLAHRTSAAAPTVPGALAPGTVARALADAEASYRAGRLVQARQSYEALVRVDPLNAHAWLRLGNLHQRAGRDDDALEAYRSATLTVPSSRAEAEARGKALLNIALLGVASASRAIDELDAMGLGALADARAEAARQAGAQRHRAARAAVRDFGAPHPGDGPDAAPAGAEAGGPWTVDRWTARARRPTARRDAPGRAMVVEPLVDAPLPAPPPVEVLRGGAAAPRP